MLVAVLVQLAMDLILFRHLIDVLVVNRIAILAPVGLDIGEQPPVDVEQLVVRQLHDGALTGSSAPPGQNQMCGPNSYGCPL